MLGLEVRGLGVGAQTSSMIRIVEQEFTGRGFDAYDYKWCKVCFERLALT